ncbi:MAG: hypothetical protein HY744_02760 [Deltaproteobacteria bacterium]|nr:hypothetical protein [Deltaproteobacteria bacterium]
MNHKDHKADCNAVDPPGVCFGRDLPWLEDTAQVDAWGLWNVSYADGEGKFRLRDVIVLGKSNEVAAVYNLTDHSLGDPSNQAALKAILLAVADAQ